MIKLPIPDINFQELKVKKGIKMVIKEKDLDIKRWIRNQKIKMNMSVNLKMMNIQVQECIMSKIFSYKLEVLKKDNFMAKVL